MKRKWYPRKIAKLGHIHCELPICILLCDSSLISQIAHSFASYSRHTGDTGFEAEDYYEPRHRYSLSDVITHIKRSIPDLRNIKHQPLENKESPAGSPKHVTVAENAAAGSSAACPLPNTRPNAFVSEFGGDNAFDNTVTLSAVQTTSCQVCELHIKCTFFLHLL